MLWEKCYLRKYALRLDICEARRTIRYMNVAFRYCFHEKFSLRATLFLLSFS